MAGAGYKLFNTGDVLLASEVNTYLQQQTVMVFASSTARTTALSGVLAEGMMSYLQDTNSVEVYNGSSWVNVGNAGDITGVTAGTGISGGGSSGDVTITNSMATAIDAKGDLIVGTGADTFSRLAVGTNDYVLTAASGEATGLKWAAPAASTPTAVGCSIYNSASQTLSNNTNTVLTFNSEYFDTDGFHSTTSNTGRITIPSGKGGKYLVIGTAYVAAGSGGTSRILRIFKNGATGTGTRLTNAHMQPVANAQTLFTSGIFDVVAGDYFQLEGWQDNGGDLSFFATDSFGFFQAILIGA